MRIGRYFAESLNSERLNTLKSLGINVNCGSVIMSFSLFEDQEQWDALHMHIPDIDDSLRLSWYEYTPAELDKAEWLTMRSTNCKLENCAPERTFKYRCKYQITRNDSESFDCYYHQKQVAPFSFAKSVKWGHTFFYACTDGGKETIFCNDIAISLMRQAGLSGISFEPVIHYNKDRTLENINQVVITNKLSDESVRFYGQAQEWHCPQCGERKYLTRQLTRVMIDRMALGDQDFYTTGDIYTDFDESSYPNAYMVLSRKAYRLLSENKMTRNLQFLPLMTY